MTPERIDRIREVLARRQPDLTVVTDQVHKPQNIAAILRTCDAVGIHGMHMIEAEAQYRARAGTAAGSHKWVRVDKYEDAESAFAALKEQDMQVVAAHFSDRAVDYREIDYTRPTALLLGAERQGVSDTAAALCDADVIIPMQGMVASFNVSVAAAIILNEAQRQRMAAGMYDQTRLSPGERQRTLFEWSQPVIGKYCRDRALAIPPIAEDGELADASGWYASVLAGREPVIGN